MMTRKEQLAALNCLVEDWAIKKDQHVKGEFTSVDFVTFKLNEIFTPAGWAFTILTGPTLVTISDTAAYAQVVGRLVVCFADGAETHQDDVGIWPLTATGARQGKTLADTKPERYETVLKAARTDCLKNAVRNLGTCFSPLTDLELRASKRRIDYQNDHPDEDLSFEEGIEELHGHQPKPKPKRLDSLFAEVNESLHKAGLEQYTSLATMKAVLKDLGHTGYSPAKHDTMRLQLTKHNEPNGKNRPPGGDA